MLATAKSLGRGAMCAVTLMSFMCGASAFASDNAAHALADKFGRAAEDSERAAAEARKAKARAKAEAASKRRAEAIAKADAEARARSEARAKAAAQARAKAQAETKAQAEADAKAQALANAAAQRAADEAEMLRRAGEEAEARRQAEFAREQERRVEAERQAARDDAQRLVEEANRQRLEMERKAEEERLAEAKRLTREVEEKRRADEQRLAAERRAAEEKRRAEEARLAEIKTKAEEAEKKRVAEEARVAELKRQAEATEAKHKAEEARFAEQRRIAETEAAAERAALEAEREDEARRIAEKFRLSREAREAREAQEVKQAREAQQVHEAHIQRAPEMLQTRSSLGGPVSEPELETASPFIDKPAAPPKSTTNVMRPPAATALSYPQRVTVLVQMDPRRHGFGGKRMTANPVLCVGESCYVSNGSRTTATAMARGRTLGPGNTLGHNAGVCRNDTTCVFRGVLLTSPNATIQPVDMGFLRHDRREVRDAKPDSSCRTTNGELTCASPIIASRYRAWIVPEEVAQTAGAGALDRALDAGLSSTRSAAYDEWTPAVHTAAPR